MLRSRKLVTSLFTSALVLGPALVACGGSSSPAATDQGDAGVYVPVVPDAAAEAAPADDPLNPNYPAPHAAMPQNDYHGARVLHAAQIVTVTFTGDALQDRLQLFGDTITATPWWDTVSDGYCDSAGCVGRGAGAGHVVLDTHDTSYDDSSQGGSSSIQDFIKAQVAKGAAAGGFPAPTTDTLYAIYFPADTTVTLDGSKSCDAFGAYHNTTKVTPPGGTEQVVAYAIMPRCGSSEHRLTVAASHEFTEAATDPDIGIGDIGYYMQDRLWAFAGGENGDLCVDFTGGNDTVQESGFVVQRAWSNNSAKAGHNPCVPIPSGEVYFNAAPAQGSDEIDLKVGESKTIEIDAFSDAPMDEWQIHATDLARMTGGDTVLDFAWDRSKVHNGSKPKLTITLTGRPSGGYAQYVVVSVSSDGTTHYWPAEVRGR